MAGGLSRPKSAPYPARMRSSSPVELTSGSVLLRGFTAEDLPALLSAFADEEIARWNPGPAGSSGPDALSAAQSWMNERNDWSDGGHASWAIGDPVGQLLGSVSLHKIDRDQGDAEVGYWMAPRARRRGRAALALATAARFAFAELELHRVYLYHAVENVPSCRVATAVGFAWEGTLRKSYRYADGAYHDEHLHGLLASDPLTRPQASG